MFAIRYQGLLMRYDNGDLFILDERLQADLLCFVLPNCQVVILL